MVYNPYRIEHGNTTEAHGMLHEIAAIEAKQIEQEWRRAQLQAAAQLELTFPHVAEMFNEINTINTMGERGEK